MFLIASANSPGMLACPVAFRIDFHLGRCKLRAYRTNSAKMSLSEDNLTLILNLDKLY